MALRSHQSSGTLAALLALTLSHVLPLPTRAAGLPTPRSLFGQDRQAGLSADRDPFADLPGPPGGVAWEFALPDYAVLGLGEADGVLVVAGVRVIFGLDPATGRERWRHTAKNELTKMDVLGGRVIIVAEGRERTIYGGLDPATGRELFRRTIVGPARLEPSRDGRLLFAASYPPEGMEPGDRTSPARLTAWDCDTGALLWQLDDPGRIGSFHDRGGVLHVPSADGYFAVDCRTGKERARLTGVKLTEGIVADGVLYGFDSANPYDSPANSSLQAYDLANGRQLWKTGPLRGRDMAIDGDAVYVNREEHVAVARTTGVTLWRHSDLEVSFGSPFAEGDHLFVGTPGWLYCLDRVTGRPLWRVIVRGDARRICAHAGRVFFSGLSTVSAVELKVPTVPPESFGRTLWSHRQARQPFTLFGGQVELRALSPLRDPPLVLGDTVAFPYGSTSPIVCLDAATGAKKWWWTGGQDVYSPTTDGSVIAFSTGWETALVEGSTGRELWRVAGKEKSVHRGPPTIAGDRVYMGTEWGDVLCHDLVTGKRRWLTKYGKDWSSATNSPADPRHRRLPSRPVVTEGLVCLGLPTRGLAAFDAATGGLKWEVNLGGPVFWRPAVSGKALLATSGPWLYAVALPSGKPAWKHQLPGDARGDPAVEGSTAYLSCNVGQGGAVCAVTATTGKRLWTYETPNRIVSPISISNRVVYVTTRTGFLHAIDATTGTRLWEHRDPLWIPSSVTVRNHVAYFGTYRGRVEALALPH